MDLREILDSIVASGPSPASDQAAEKSTFLAGIELVDALHRANDHTGPVLDVDAGFSDHCDAAHRPEPRFIIAQG
jgi:hypothetical protein